MLSTPWPVAITHQCQLPSGVLYVNEYGASTAPALLILGGISATRDAITAAGDGWWQGLAAAIESHRWRVFTLDYGGGNGDSSIAEAPTSIAAQAQLCASALQQLGVTELAAIVGGSYGGLVGLEIHRQGLIPVPHLAIIGAAHRPTAQAVMLRHIQRELVRLGDAAGVPARGAQLARALAMLSYRSADAMDQFYPDPQAAVAYIESRGLRTVTRSLPRTQQLFEVFGPALDNYRIDPASINAATLLLGFDSDQLVPPAVLHEFAEQLPDCQGCWITPSSYGHDGFIKDTERYAELLRQFLQQALAEASC
ncbi:MULTISPECIES: alpha/beta fold hydrolase [Pseudidiomarina]|uniref:Homoserine O-acetyltransferase n=2 Tax=Pseudidiomarina TaxID=2800384 RepID=A0A368V225_9GAMM|nr:MULTISPECIES: alpha/beta fold hydrolase [Pseudidiomarina]PWW14166.1 homoserine O-acetyltransferase [Pseudidiomarina maritima]RBP91980.1 homoserine O-acetyltransferase [Pseudidiomarina tainanensis]RCW33744.1 homoserine O-acetyltransferase [Pseudidiomarina tainanensis]